MTASPSQPRITPLDDDRDPPMLNIFRTMSRNKELYKSFLALGGHLLAAGLLPEREREIVILRVGWRAGSEYEFGQHTGIGRKAGLTDAEIDRLADAGTGEWDAADAALVRLVDELCDGDMVTARTWSELAGRWSDEQMLELLVLAGFYRLVSGMLNSVGVALEPQTAGWPASAAPGRSAPRERVPE
jgi:4-carboxymuconolactone decarboxylase